MREKLKQTALKGAAKYAAEELELLKELASIDCGTGDEAGNERVVELLCRLLDTLDCEVELPYHEGYGKHIVARIRPEHPDGKILLVAHTDTVFQPGDVEQHPVRIEDDWIYGLGIADCKGGVVSSIYSLKIMQEAGMLPNKEIVIIFNCDEEIGSPTGRIYFEKEAKDADMAFVFEPARDENGVLTFRKGMVAFDIDITGITAHPGVSYNEGRSAVIELAYQTVRLYEKNNPELGISYSISPISGGSKTGGIPEYANAGGFTTIGCDEAMDQVKRDIAAIETDVVIDGCINKTNIELAHPCMKRTPENRAIYRTIREAGALLGQELPEQETSGASDANLLSGYGLPTVCGLGPYIRDIHTFDERMWIPTIEEKTALFAAVLGLL